MFSICQYLKEQWIILLVSYEFHIAIIQIRKQTIKIKHNKKTTKWELCFAYFNLNGKKCFFLMGWKKYTFHLVTISKRSRSVLILFETGNSKLYAHFRCERKQIGRMGAIEHWFSRRSTKEWVISIFAPSISDKICNFSILSIKMRWFLFSFLLVFS